MYRAGGHRHFPGVDCLSVTGGQGVVSDTNILEKMIQRSFSLFCPIPSKSFCSAGVAQNGSVGEVQVLTQKTEGLHERSGDSVLGLTCPDVLVYVDVY